MNEISYSLKRTQLGPLFSPAPTVAKATTSPSFPDLTSRLYTTTRLSSCSAEATKSPALLSENPRGLRPPAGAIWTRDRAPVFSLIEKETMGSEGMVVAEPLNAGMVSVFWPREEMRTNRWSGWVVR